jgi:hypothetical protein
MTTSVSATGSGTQRLTIGETTKLKLETRTNGTPMQSPDTSILISDRAAHQCCSTIFERMQAT